MHAAVAPARARERSTPQRPGLVQLAAPVAGGVRDYWRGLQQAWAAQALPSSVIELDAAGVRSLPLAARLAPAMDDGPCTLLLHFSGYGFHPRGLCDWLVDEVEAAQGAAGPRLRVATLFHELFASGPPWRSAFWLGRRQAAIAARLARASDLVITNTRHHADWLARRLRPGTPLLLRPVFSTVGEPAVVAPSIARAPQLLVFGSASTRSRALARLPRHAARLRRLGVQEVVEAGSGESVDWRCRTLPLRRLGALDLPALQVLLGASRWALIDYPPQHLGKSTVFAAYAVHGAAVLNTAAPGPEADGLFEGLHYQALAGPGTLWAQAPQRLADAARHWYADHTLALQARALADALAGPAGGDAAQGRVAALARS